MSLKYEPASVPQHIHHHYHSAPDGRDVYPPDGGYTLHPTLYTLCFFFITLQPRVE